MTTINVNLSACTFFGVCNVRGAHIDKCPAKPVLVPLPLEPWRSVTMKVRLGECWGVGPGRCVSDESARRFKWNNRHSERCPARPVEVTCSIRGKAWAESEVAEIEYTPEGTWVPEIDRQRETALEAASRARWALVKALVMGASKVTEFPTEFRLVPAVSEMMIQRDAVYAAICEIARTEAANLAAQERLVRMLDPKRAMVRPTPEDRRPSSHGLAIYVARLIEQVVALS